jgi:two-component system NarL family response regulator
MGAIVNAQPDMVVVAEAANGDQALALYRTHLPDVVLMDMRMPGRSGFEAVALIRAEFPQAHIVALSTFGGDEDIRRALQAGAKSYLTKDVLHDDLIAAIRAAYSGQNYLPRPLKAMLEPGRPHAELSSRELEVLRLIVRGASNKQISYELNMAEYTVKNHVKSILKKLEVDDRTQAATSAIQRGIIHLQS